MLILGVFGLFTQMFYTMHSALLTSICHPDKRGQVSSFQVFFASMGWMIGSGVSNVIYANFSIEGSLGFAAGFALLAGIVAMFSPAKQWNHKELQSKAKETEGEESILTEISIKQKQITVRVAEDIDSTKDKPKVTYFDIFKRKNILILLGILAIMDFGIGPFNVVSNVYLKKVGLTGDAISISNMIATFIGMVILLFMGKFLDKRGRKPVLIFALAMYPLIYGLMYALASYKVAIFILYLYPLYALKVPTANAIMSDLTEENERARGMSLVQFEQILFGNTGAFLACFIADIVPQELLIIPLFPLGFGVLAVILAIIILKETDKKILMKKKKPEGEVLG